MRKENNKDKKIIEEVGSIPCNSRIFISYLQSPPEIKFEYPDDSVNQVRDSSLVYLIAIAITFMILLLLVSSWVFYLERSYPGSSDAHIDFVKINEYPELNNYTELYVEYTWMNKTEITVVKFRREGQFWYYPALTDTRVTNRALFLEILPIVVVYILFFIILIGVARLVSLLFYKTNWGHKAFPELNKRLHDKKYSAEFFKDDVVPKVKYTDATNTLSVDKWVVELPMFQNMYMDYEASGEFSKYLEKISIVEHPFSKYVKKEGKEMKKSRRQLRKEERLARKNAKEYDSSKFDKYYNKKPNIYLWKCIFEFKQKPEDGSSLKIWFT